MATIIWEHLDSGEFRGKVPGGWLIREETINYVPAWNTNSHIMETHPFNIITTTFIPDLNHTWDMIDLLTNTGK